MPKSPSERKESGEAAVRVVEAHLQAISTMLELMETMSPYRGKLSAKQIAEGMRAEPSFFEGEQRGRRNCSGACRKAILPTASKGRATDTVPRYAASARVNFSPCQQPTPQRQTRSKCVHFYAIHQNSRSD
jgi:hypothetical protein